MTSSSEWKVTQYQDNILLINARFNDEGYEILLSDLACIWGESLSRTDIIQRASESKSVIDASDKDQYKILLSKLEAAVNRHEDTTFDLRKGDNDRELHLSARLPGALPPLQWTMQLRCQPAWALGAQLLSPVLSRILDMKRDVEVLTQELSAKDRVITRMGDRLELAGMDLTTVFPGVSNIKLSRKKSQRAQLAGHVKGLAEYDGEVLRRRHREESEVQSLEIKDYENALEGVIVPRLQSLVKSEEAAKLAKPAPVASEAIIEDDDATESESERDSVLDRALSPKDPAPSEPAAESESRSENDVTIEPTSPTSPNSSTPDPSTPHDPEPSNPPPNPRERIRPRIGTLGGKKPSPIPPPASSSDTASVENPIKQRPKLGTLGGRPQSRIGTTSSPAPQNPLAEISAREGETPSGSGEASSALPLDGGEKTAGLPEAREEKLPERAAPKPMTADERRNELKRELQGVSKAPVKKKRKF